MRVLRGLVILAAVAVVLVASWVPDSRMVELAWILRRVAEWADENETLRTGVAFLFLTGVLTFVSAGVRPTRRAAG